MNRAQQPKAYWKPVTVPCYAPVCVGCGCNIFTEGQAEYAGFDLDGLTEEMCEWQSCPKCMWPLTETEEGWMREQLEEEGHRVQSMPLPEIVPLWRERCERVRKANAERARQRRYGVTVTQYGH